MARFGSIEQYATGSDFEDYIDRVEQFFAANDVPLMNEPTAEHSAKQKGIFLSSIGAETYTLLKDLVAPSKPKEKSYEELKETLLRHLKPKRLVMSERFRFHSRKQREGETVTQFQCSKFAKMFSRQTNLASSSESRSCKSSRSREFTK